VTKTWLATELKTTGKSAPEFGIGVIHRSMLGLRVPQCRRVAYGKKT
jgi:hypothetical protein